jgi:hypothetical protein
LVSFAAGLGNRLRSSSSVMISKTRTTYLMGRVTQREADRATEIARSTPGVQKVVRVFEIITEDELRSLLPKPAANEAKASPVK